MSGAYLYSHSNGSDCHDLSNFINDSSGDGYGVGGIEGNFNSILSGDTTITMIKKGVKGKYHKQINYAKSTNGYDITLTIDLEYQRIIQD